MFQCKGSPLPILETGDPIDREVEFVPTKAPYDPRWMLNGRQNPGNPTDIFFIGSRGENFFVLIINGCVDFNNSLVENYMSCTNLLKYTNCTVS